MKTLLAACGAAFLLSQVLLARPMIEVSDDVAPYSFVLADSAHTAAIVVDPADYTVVHVAAGLFADDVRRVTGRRPAVGTQPSGGDVVIVGTLGHSAVIDRLAREQKLKDVDALRGRWEATLWQIVDRPLPGVKRALVIAGSDRRGAAYGLMVLSQKIGVSPWYWWADVPPHHAQVLAVNLRGPQTDAPGVKYRGIFINDEDWGLNPWASKTFDPKFGNIGPKTYNKVFELLLRLRLNYLWPAMHACSAEFASQPENFALADRYGIVAGSSHCEPMLCNNVHWNEKTQGKWDYTVNRDAIHAYWAASARTRGPYEAVWTLGIRGIHDAAMEGPRPIPTRIHIVTDVIHDQRALLDRYVSKQWGPIAQCFVPYKEVLPIYDGGLKVPPDVTLVWTDDNFGYIRRLSDPAERRRPGGAGVYWHLSYYGGPHSYTWINTTAPGLMWEELHKAWQNDARTLWMLNVGDIKPAEIGIDFYARLAWAPDEVGPDAQTGFLRDFAARAFGPAHADARGALLDRYYRLGTIRKPELMTRAWALGLTAQEATTLDQGYRGLLATEAQLSRELAPDQRDAFFEMIGFPARVLAQTGLIFLADRNVQLGIDATASSAAITRLRDSLEADVQHYNTGIEGGKWNHIMPGLVTGRDLMKWSSQVRWPWGEPAAEAGKPAQAPGAPANALPAGEAWRDAANCNLVRAAGDGAKWQPVTGLGCTGRALTVLPAALSSSWPAGDAAAPALGYTFQSKAGTATAWIDFLPTFRIYPGMKLRVALSVDGQRPIVVEVPGSSGAEDERGPIRQNAVQDNYVRARVPLGGLAAGRHRLEIAAMDPGVVIDRVALP